MTNLCILMLEILIVNHFWLKERILKIEGIILDDWKEEKPIL